MATLGGIPGRRAAALSSRKVNEIPAPTAAKPTSAQLDRRSLRGHGHVEDGP